MFSFPRNSPPTPDRAGRRRHDVDQTVGIDWLGQVSGETSRERLVPLTESAEGPRVIAEMSRWAHAQAGCGPPDQRKAVLIGHPDVRNEDVVSATSQQVQGFPPSRWSRRRRPGFPARSGSTLSHRRRRRRQAHARRRASDPSPWRGRADRSAPGTSSTRSGNSTRKVEPWPTPSLSAATVPPCASTRCLTIEEPSPGQPCWRVFDASICLNRWNRCSRNRRVNPLPVVAHQDLRRASRFDQA